MARYLSRGERIGRYTVVDILAVGGEGATYRARKAAMLLPHIFAAYQDFRFQEVIRLTESLLPLDDATREQIVPALVLAAASAYLQNNRDLAREYFREALEMNPRLELNTKVFPTAILDFFQAVKSGR